MVNFKRKDIVIADVPHGKPARAEVLRHMRDWNGEIYEIRLLEGSGRFGLTHISGEKLRLLERDGKPVQVSNEGE